MFDYLRIPVDSLNQHLVCTGAPGSGKSNFKLLLILQLLMNGVSILALEGAKTEARVLKQLGEQLDSPLGEALRSIRYYTVGNDNVNRQQLCPFAITQGVRLNRALSTLAEWFDAIFPMFPPLPQVCTEATEQLLRETSRSGQVPSIHALRPFVQAAIRRKEYPPDLASSIMGAFDSRMIPLTTGMLGAGLSGSYENVRIEDTFATSSVHEFDALNDFETAADALLLLLRTRDWIRTNPVRKPGLRHAIILDEAHTMIGVDDDARPDEVHADPKAYLSKLVNRACAEFRADEIALCIFDQSPAQISEFILKNSGTKIAFRQQDGADRDTMGAAMLLDEFETDDLGRLRTGEAYVWSSGFHCAQKIQTPVWQEAIENATCD